LLGIIGFVIWIISQLADVVPVALDLLVVFQPVNQ